MSTQTPVDVAKLPAPKPSTRFVLPPRPVVHRALDHLHITPWRLLKILAFALLAGILAYGGYSGVAVLLLVGGAAAVIASETRRLRRESVLWLTLAVGLALIPLFRASFFVWLPVVASVIACLVAAGRIRLRGSFFNQTWTQLFGIAYQGVASSFWAAPWCVKALNRMRRPEDQRWQRPILRAAAITLPIVLIVWALLASADAVFRNLFEVHLNVPVIASVIIGFGIGLVGIVVLLGVGLTRDSKFTSPGWVIGRIEQLTVMTALCLVLGTFIATQIATSLGQGLQTLHDQGITVADYARSGWFQMLAVVGISALVVLTFRALRPSQDSPDRAYQMVATTLLLLTGGLLAAALQRLALYDHAFGLTVLRLSCWFGAAWIALVLLLLIAQTWNIRAHSQWFPGAALIAAVLVSLAWGASNPIAIIVRHDVERTHVDAEYLRFLGTDAIAPLLAAHPQNPRTAADITSNVCADAAPTNSVRQFSLAVEQARTAWIAHCPAALAR